MRSGVKSWLTSWQTAKVRSDRAALSRSRGRATSSLRAAITYSTHRHMRKCLCIVQGIVHRAACKRLMSCAEVLEVNADCAIPSQSKMSPPAAGVTPSTCNTQGRSRAKTHTCSMPSMAAVTAARTSGAAAASGVAAHMRKPCIHATALIVVPYRVEKQISRHAWNAAKPVPVCCIAPQVHGVALSS